MPQTIYIKDYDTEVEIPDGANMEQVRAALQKQFPTKVLQSAPAEQEDLVSMAARRTGIKQTMENFKNPNLEEAVPALGAVAGLAASGMNPIGGVGGYYAGKQLMRASQGNIGTPGQQIGDLSEGMVQEIFGGLLNLGKEGVKKIAPEILERIKLARETGVDLSPAAIKGTKGLAQLESLLDKNITSSTIAQKGHEKTVKEVGEFARRVQQQFGGKASMLQAGEKAQVGAKGRYGSFMAKAQKLYSAVPVRPDTLVETNNLRDTAIGMLDEIGKYDTPAMKRILRVAQESVDPKIQFRPGTPAAESTLSDPFRGYGTVTIGKKPPMTTTTIPAGTGGIVDATGQPFVGGNMPTYTWQSLTADRNALNQMWRQSSDPNRKRMIGNLVNSIDDDIAKFSEISPDVKTAFDKATKFYKFGDESLPGIRTFRDRQVQQVLNTSSTEDVVNKFIKPNNVSDIKRFVSAAGTEGTQVVKQAWLEKLLTKGEEQSFSPAKFATAFDKYDADTLKAFLSNEEISGLKKLSQISRIIDKSEKIAGNPSGTAQNVMSAGWVASMINHPVITVSAAIGSNKFAKLYFGSPEFRKSLVQGFKMSPKSKQAINMANRLAVIAGIQTVSKKE